MRPNEPFERRDADGGYGDRPQQPQQRQRRERDYADDARPFDEWVVEEQMQYEYEMEGAGESRGATLRGEKASRRRRRRRRRRGGERRRPAGRARALGPGRGVGIEQGVRRVGRYAVMRTKDLHCTRDSYVFS